jgi:hypothetical protein
MPRATRGDRGAVRTRSLQPPSIRERCIDLLRGPAGAGRPVGLDVWR